MAYPPHSLVSFGGVIHGSGSNDIWQCGVRVVDTDDQGALGDDAAYMNDIAPALRAWFVLPASGMRNDCTLNFLKVNAIDGAGHYADPGNTNAHEYAPGPTGGASIVGPAFLSLVYTWETGFLRGLAHRGRIYPPNSSVPVAAGDEVNSAEVTNIVNAGKALLEVLRNRSNEGRGAFPVVASKTGGNFRGITGVSVDNVYDTQRRRKNAVKGVRTAVAWVP